MMNRLQARNFVKEIFNGLEQSVLKKDDAAVKTKSSEFKSAIREYRDIIGAKEVSTHMKSYVNLLTRGGYVPK